MGAPSQRGWRLFLDPMLTAQDKLNQALISWYSLLSGWSLDGSLATSAEHAFNLDGENAIEGAEALTNALF